MYFQTCVDFLTRAIFVVVICKSVEQFTVLSAVIRHFCISEREGLVDCVIKSE